MQNYKTQNNEVYFFYNSKKIKSNFYFAVDITILNHLKDILPDESGA